MKILFTPTRQPTMVTMAEAIMYILKSRPPQPRIISVRHLPEGILFRTLFYGLILWAHTRSYSSVGRAVGQLGRARYRFVFSRLENIVPRKQKIGTLFIIETISEMQEQQQQWQQHLKLQEKSPGHSFVFDKKHRFISFCVCHITLCRTVSFGC